MPPVPGRKTRMRVNAYTVPPTLQTQVAYRTNGTVFDKYKEFKGSTYHISGTQVTESEGHPWTNRKRPSKDGKPKNKLPDVGGEFFTQNRYIWDFTKFPRFTVRWKQNYGDYNVIRESHFAGTGLPSSFPLTLTNAQFPPPSTLSDDNLKEMGTTAIARCSPSNSPANVSTAVAEIAREGLPSLPGLLSLKDKGTSPAAKASGEFLNYQFGIAPVISDAKKFVSAVKNMDDVIAQFEADAGKVVRRRYYFPVERTVQETVVSSTSTPWASTSNNSSTNPTWGITYRTGAQCVRRREIVRRVWFSGAFTYYMPTGMDSRGKIAEMRLRADRLGAELTPETLWNLAPWSWAVDWFSNTGDYIHNLSSVAKYGLILHYGYIMEHTRVSDTYRRTNLWTSGSDPQEVRLPSTTLVTETKRRLKASPFGFGFQMSDLSSTQQAILAALGISRSSR